MVQTMWFILNQSGAIFTRTTYVVYISLPARIFIFFFDFIPHNYRVSLLLFLSYPSPLLPYTLVTPPYVPLYYRYFIYYNNKKNHKTVSTVSL